MSHEDAVVLAVRALEALANGQKPELGGERLDTVLRCLREIPHLIRTDDIVKELTQEQSRVLKQALIEWPDRQKGRVCAASRTLLALRRLNLVAQPPSTTLTILGRVVAEALNGR